MEFLINETLAGRGERLKGYNIALEVFDRPAVHGVGGATGVLLTAIFVDAALGGAGLSEGRSVTGQFAIQLVGVLATLIWSVLLNFIITKLVQAVLGLRVRVETEELGIDAKVHGERCTTGILPGGC